MLETLPKVWGIALAAIIAVVAFMLWHVFQTSAEREAATLNLRVLADAVPYGGGWYMAVFNLGPAANITGVWTTRGFVPIGEVLGMGQNMTFALADRPLKLQVCAVGHRSACELVEVAGWMINVPEFGTFINTTLTVNVTCTSVSLTFYNIGFTDVVANWRGTTIKKYVISTAAPLYVIAYASNGSQYTVTLPPGANYSLNIKDKCPLKTATATTTITATVTATVSTTTVTSTATQTVAATTKTVTTTATDTVTTTTTVPTTTVTTTTTTTVTVTICNAKVSVDLSGTSNVYIQATASLTSCAQQVSDWHWYIEGGSSVRATACTDIIVGGETDTICGSASSSALSCNGVYYEGSDGDTITLFCSQT